MPRLFITGAAGQLGAALCRRLRHQALYEVVALDREALDITDAQSVWQTVEHIRPDVMINAAAYTDVDDAEREMTQAIAVNVEGARYLARAAKNIGALLIHLSSDYVFGGEGERPYTEEDRPAPCTHYGWSKWLGEQAVAEETPHHIILRTAWLFGEEGDNFVKTLLRLSTEQSDLRMVDDQVGGPTYIGDVVETILAIVQHSLSSPQGLRGTYHFTGRPYVSRYQLAQAIFAEALAQGVLQKMPHVEAISSTHYPAPARRPKNSCLALDKVLRDFQILPSDWRSALKQVVSDYKNRTTA